MLPLRLYIVALTLLFLIVVMATRAIGPLEAVVVVGPLLYLILDLREELVKLRQLEANTSLLISLLSR